MNKINLLSGRKLLLGSVWATQSWQTHRAFAWRRQSCYTIFRSQKYVLLCSLNLRWWQADSGAVVQLIVLAGRNKSKYSRNVVLLLNTGHCISTEISLHLSGLGMLPYSVVEIKPWSDKILYMKRFFWHGWEVVRVSTEQVLFPLRSLSERASNEDVLQITQNNLLKKPCCTCPLDVLLL